MNNRIIITGAPGTGKTTVINGLKGKKIKIKTEAARRVIDENLNKQNTILPWENRTAFDSMVLREMLFDYYRITENIMTFYDGGLPDILAYEMFLGLKNKEFNTIVPRFDYNKTVIILEPWESIYKQDEIRPWAFSDVKKIHECILSVYEKLNYDIFIVKSNTTTRQRIETIIGKFNEKAAHNKL